MIDQAKMPQVEDIQDFITTIVNGLKLHPITSKSIVILALVLLEKAIVKSQELNLNQGNSGFNFFDIYNKSNKKPQLQIYPMNWRPLMFTSILIATKFYEDKYFWNIDVVERLKIFDIEHTNKYEHLLVRLLDFEFKIKQQKLEDYFKCLVLYQQYTES